MLPVLFSIGPISISSFGLFLALAFLYATFLAWRLARAFDLSEEKILDLVLLTFFGGLLGARILFIALNFPSFGVDPLKWVLITKYPGLLFFGALLGGILTLFIFSKRLKLDFWQSLDIASVALLGGLILGNLGCFLGGCSYGAVSNSIFATPLVGVLEKRFPVQVIEAVILALVLWRIWPKAIHFHFNGKIVSLNLIILGIVKLFLEFFREKQYGFLGFGVYTFIFATGIFIFYKRSKRNVLTDLKILFKSLIDFLTNSGFRVELLKKLQKNWYNQTVGLNWKFKGLKGVLKKANVRPTPKSFL